jgi:predicted oxidoreductase
MERKAQIARIKALAEKWLKPLGLLWWRKIEFVYYEDRGHFKKEGHTESVMITYASWPYLEAVVEVNLYAIAEADDETLEYYFVHEMVHILTDEIVSGKKREDNVERGVTQIARAFLWVAEMIGGDSGNTE